MQYRKLSRLVKEVRGVHSTMSIQQLDMLITIAEEPGIGTWALVKALGITNVSIGRNRDKLALMGLLRWQEDKEHTFWLTPKGQALVKLLATICDS